VDEAGDDQEPTLKEALAQAHARAREPHTETDRLRADIEATRAQLGELSRRWRETLDLRLQLRRHPLVFFAGAVLIVAAVSGVGAALSASRRRRRRSPAASRRPTSAAARLVTALLLRRLGASGRSPA
jgi:hypothetical protein